MAAFVRALGAVVVLAALAVACDASDDVQGWLAGAEALHADVDRRLAADDVQGASDALEAFVNAPAPGGTSPGTRRIVLQDAGFRLARLALARDDAGSALRWTDAMLALGSPADVFVANLLIARGHALESLGRDREAAAAWHEAQIVHEALLTEALTQPGGPSP